VELSVGGCDHVGHLSPPKGCRSAHYLPVGQ
jgi:hypothetical protein